MSADFLAFELSAEDRIEANFHAEREAAIGFAGLVQWAEMRGAAV